MGPLCCPRVFSSLPPVDQILANPSYEPVASRVPALFQSSDVTSLLLGTSWPPRWMQCFRTISFWVLSMAQMRAVLSPLPEAKRSYIEQQ